MMENLVHRLEIFLLTIQRTLKRQKKYDEKIFLYFTTDKYSLKLGTGT